MTSCFSSALQSSQEKRFFKERNSEFDCCNVDFIIRLLIINSKPETQCIAVVLGLKLQYLQNM